MADTFAQSSSLAFVVPNCPEQPCEASLERVFLFLSCLVLFFLANSEIEVSVSARNVRRLLSFQRYLRSSRFFRGITVPNSSNILDDDYNGQAKVGRLIFITFKVCF